MKLSPKRSIACAIVASLMYLAVPTKPANADWVECPPISKHVGYTSRGAYICKLVGNGKVIYVIGEQLDEYLVTVLVETSLKRTLLVQFEVGCLISSCSPVIAEYLILPNKTVKWLRGDPSLVQNSFRQDIQDLINFVRKDTKQY